LSLVGTAVGIVILGLIGVGVGLIVGSLTPALPECDCRPFDLGCGLACSIAGSAYRAIPLGTGMFGGLIGLALGIPGGLILFGPHLSLKGNKNRLSLAV